METISSQIWKSILGLQSEAERTHLFQHLLKIGEPFSPRPQNVSEFESAPYELIIDDQRPLHVSGLMQFDHLKEKWICQNVLPLYTQGPDSLWEITSLPNREDGNGHIHLLNQDGKELSAFCPVHPLYPEFLHSGDKYLCSLYLIADQIKPEETSFLIKEGPAIEEEIAKRKKENPHFNPGSSPCLSVDISDSKAILQAHSPQSDFLTKIDEIESLHLGNHKGYKITCNLAAIDTQPIPVTLFAFSPSWENFIPKKGDFISGYGHLFVHILAKPPVLVIKEKGAPNYHENLPVCSEKTDLATTAPSWQDSPEIALKQQEEEHLHAAMKFLEQREDIPLYARVVIGGFIHNGWNLLGVNNKLFSKMIPIAYLSKENYGQFAFFIDAEQKDAFSYPEISEEEQNYITQSCSEKDFNHIRIQVDILKKEQGYNFKVKLPSHFVCPGLNFLLHAPLSKKEDAPDTVCKKAAHHFAKSILKKDLSYLSPYLSEDFDFSSDPMKLKLKGKITFLRYFSMTLSGWAKNNISPQPKVGTVNLNGENHVCLALYNNLHLCACTLLTSKDGYITSMHTLPENLIKNLIVLPFPSL